MLGDDQCTEKTIDKPLPLRILGRATIDGKTVTRDTLPSDDTMQAFLWRHLVPHEETLLFMHKNKGWVPAVNYSTPVPFVVKLGTPTPFTVKLSIPPRLENVEFVLKEAPIGMTLGKTEYKKDTCILEFLADSKLLKEGTEGNLIVEFFGVWVSDEERKQKKQKKATYLYTLPAIPYKVGL